MVSATRGTHTNLNLPGDRRSPGVRCWIRATPALTRPSASIQPSDRPAATSLTSSPRAWRPGPTCDLRRQRRHDQPQLGAFVSGYGDPCRSIFASLKPSRGSLSTLPQSTKCISCMRHAPSRFRYTRKSSGSFRPGSHRRVTRYMSSGWR